MKNDYICIFLIYDTIFDVYVYSSIDNFVPILISINFLKQYYVCLFLLITILEKMLFKTNKTFLKFLLYLLRKYNEYTICFILKIVKLRYLHCNFIILRDLHCIFSHIYYFWSVVIK